MSQQHRATKIIAAGTASFLALAAILSAASTTQPAFAAQASFPHAKDITVHVKHDVQSTGTWLRGNHNPELHYVVTSEAGHGYLEFNGLTGQVWYTPNHGFRGVDSFTYVIAASYPYQESNTATVTIVVR